MTAQVSHTTIDCRDAYALSTWWKGVLDYVDVVVHIQHTEERAFYGLERLWKDCPRIEVDGLEPGDTDGDQGADAS